VASTRGVAAVGPPGPAERRRLLLGLGQPPAQAAPWLLGKRLVRRRGRAEVVVRIVETEAYLGPHDPAAHAARGRTARTEPLWGPPGTVYVYLVYGMHHCLNLAADAEGVPGCVLIRAAEVVCGPLAPMACRGPGRLCRALHLDTRFSGQNLFARAAALTLRDGPPPARIAVSPRIGIRHAADWPLRFFDAQSPAVTRGRSEAPSSLRRRGPRPRVAGRAG
jgi:DNA-3-methyladenine glycosylase